MYQIRTLLLCKDDLWSKGMIQQIYLDDAESTILFCLGIVQKNHWEPLHVQGKIGYAYQFEADAQEICANQPGITFIDRNASLQKTLASAVAS